MKITAFRLGNIVSLAYETDRFGAIVAMDLSGSIHLSNRETPDDIRDIVGTKVTEKVLSLLGCETVMTVNGTRIIISVHKSSLFIDSVPYNFKFLHQLQNIFYFNTGQELIAMADLLSF